MEAQSRTEEELERAPVFEKAPGLGSIFGSRRAIGPARQDATAFTERPAAQRRSRIDIYFDVLTAVGAAGEAKPTLLMFNTNLCWRSLGDALGYLAERGLVSSRRDGARRLITITPTGRACLERFYQARSFMLAEPRVGKGAPPNF